MPSKKKRKSKLLKKDTESMVVELKKEEENCEDIYQVVVSKLQTGTDLKYKETRKKFVEALCSVPVKEQLHSILRLMVSTYTRLLKQYSKGKRFALFEKAWLLYIEEFFTDTIPESDGCYSTWKSVVDSL